MESKNNDHFCSDYQRRSYGYIKVVAEKVGEREMSNCLTSGVKVPILIGKNMRGDRASMDGQMIGHYICHGS